MMSKNKMTLDNVNDALKDLVSNSYSFDAFDEEMRAIYAGSCIICMDQQKGAVMVTDSKMLQIFVFAAEIDLDNKAVTLTKLF